MMIIGFTGTRSVLPEAQRITLGQTLFELYRAGTTELHHGDCVGADAMAHQYAIDMGCPVVVHPPTNNRSRAFCTGTRFVHPPHPYLKRNRHIVQACDMLVACPSGPEHVRSGTWSTIRVARELCRVIVIIGPDGERIWE